MRAPFFFSSKIPIFVFWFFCILKNFLSEQSRADPKKNLLPLLRGQLGEVDHALRVAPLVVVPRDHLDHVVAHHHRQARVDRRRLVGAREVLGDQRLVRDVQHALHGARGGLAEGGVDLLGEGLLLDLDDEVDDRDVGGGHAQGDAVELALEPREDEGDGLGRARGGGHDVEGRGARAAQVAVRRVQQALVARVRVRGGHRALDDAELLVEDLDEGSEAVGGARGVGDDLVRVLVVLGVDADDVGGDVVLKWRRGKRWGERERERRKMLVFFFKKTSTKKNPTSKTKTKNKNTQNTHSLGRGRDQDLLGPGLQVLAGALRGDEDTGALDDEVDVLGAPGKLRRVARRDDLDRLAVDRDGRVVDDAHVGVEGAERGVVLEQVRGLLDASGVVDDGDVEERVGAAALDAAEEVAADAAEAVDGDVDLLLGDDVGAVARGGLK